MLRVHYEHVDQLHKDVLLAWLLADEPDTYVNADQIANSLLIHKPLVKAAFKDLVAQSVLQKAQRGHYQFTQQVIQQMNTELEGAYEGV